MATLVLTAAGTAIGGPVGGAIGALIGQQADAALFAPKPRHGPRLGELALQTSSYGTAIPKIFGIMRAAGTVIWATDLKERRTTDGGGKGRPKTVSYSYSACFAVALSGRPIRSVRRIWADGKLLRGAAGDFKVNTKFRLYTGSEDQPVDPLIASAEGASQTPAFRGLAYAMFEDFELADYGNRIPSLTFEIVAEEGEVAIGAVAEELSAGMLDAAETPTLVGYAAGGDSIRGALEGLADAASLSLIDDGGRLVIGAAAAAPVSELPEDAGARAGGAGGPTQISRQALNSVPDEVSLAYHDPARDYQTGLQRSGLGTAAARAERLALPVVLTASSAKAFADHGLAARLASRSVAKVYLPLRCLGIGRGSEVKIPGRSGLWRVERWSLGEQGLVSLELAGAPTAVSVFDGDADPGRPVREPDIEHGPTTLHLFELPPLEIYERPQLVAVAAGVAAGWRRASLMTSFDGGSSWAPVGATAEAATIGVAVNSLAEAGSALIDANNSVEVELLSDGMWLEGRSDDALANGANLAMLGEELIQFGQVEALGARHFRLSRLLRGRNGTEWSVGGHAPGDVFALLEPDKAVSVDLPVSMIGGEARVLALGIADEEGVLVSRLVSGEAVRPPAPVHLRAVRQANGDIDIRWVRRSRNGWDWLSETPLGEERELYRLELSGSGFSRSVTLAEPRHSYGVAEQTADALAGALKIALVQIGTFAPSRAAILELSEESWT